MKNLFFIMTTMGKDRGCGYFGPYFDRGSALDYIEKNQEGFGNLDVYIVCMTGSQVQWAPEEEPVKEETKPAPKRKKK